MTKNWKSSQCYHVSELSNTQKQLFVVNFQQAVTKNTDVGFPVEADWYSHGISVLQRAQIKTPYCFISLFISATVAIWSEKNHESHHCNLRVWLQNLWKIWDRWESKSAWGDTRVYKAEMRNKTKEGLGSRKGSTWENEKCHLEAERDAQVSWGRWEMILGAFKQWLKEAAEENRENGWAASEIKGSDNSSGW